MNTPEWIEYTGSDEQLKELLTTKSKFMVDNKWSVFHKPTTLNMPATEDNLNWLASLLRDTKVKRYLICQPHPYADVIKIWADTGCQVWYRALECKDFKGQCLNDEFNLYPFARPDKYEYSLTPFED